MTNLTGMKDNKNNSNMSSFSVCFLSILNHNPFLFFSNINTVHNKDGKYRLTGGGGKRNMDHVAHINVAHAAPCPAAPLLLEVIKVF